MNRVSKTTAEYPMETLTVAALRRADLEGVDPSPGQSVQLVVVDAKRRSVNHV